MTMLTNKQLATQKRYGETTQDYNMPKWRQSIKVYSVNEDRCLMEYYNADLNSVLTKLRRDYFIDKIKLRVEDSEGYVEYIG
jgi:hypothetical protein